MTRRRLALALLVPAWLLALTGPAAAHVGLAAAAPAENETVTSAPTEVRLEFSGPLEAGGEHAIGVFGPGEQRVDGGAVTELSDRAVSTTIGDPPEPGAYTVRWLVVGADGHPIEGTYAFTYAAAVVVPSPPPTTAAPSPEPAPSPSPSVTASPEPEPSPQMTEPAATEGGVTPAPLAAAVAAVAVVGLGAVYLRRRNGA